MSAVLQTPTASALPGASPRLRGWVDLARLSTVAVASERTGPTIKLQAPWMHVEVDAAVGDSTTSPGAVVVALGKPRLAGRAATAARLAAAVEDGSFKAEDLGGRYALLMLDRRAGAVTLLTDRFAVWPLCWHIEEQRLAFADRADGVPTASTAALDAQALYNYIYFHVIPAPRTVFCGVSRLEPASELRFDRHGAAIRRTWQPHFATQRAAPVAELQSEFLRCVRESVAAEAADGAVGCFLSGGTDSSTVAGMLKQVTGRAATFSMGFDQRGYDEMEYARIAARHFGTEHHEHYVTPAELVAAIPKVAAHYDQPFGNSSAVPAFICARLARSHGVEHLLAGDGGDELFGGNSRYAKQKIFEAWWLLPGAARAALAPALANGLTRAVPLARKAASYVDQASVPMPARIETYNLLQRFGAGAVLTPRFLDSIVESEPAALQRGVYERQRGAPFVDRMLAYDWRFTLADNDLPKVTGTTALAGLSVGFPLLDDALLDLSTRITARDKVRGLRLRHFFKQALSGFLPQEIIEKKKHGFGLPVGAWLVSDAAFRALARDSVAALATRGVVRAELVDDLFSRRLEQHAGYYGEMVWILIMLEQWLSARAPAWKP